MKPFLACICALSLQAGDSTASEQVDRGDSAERAYRGILRARAAMLADVDTTSKAVEHFVGRSDAPGRRHVWLGVTGARLQEYRTLIEAGEDAVAIADVVLESKSGPSEPETRQSFIVISRRDRNGHWRVSGEVPRREWADASGPATSPEIVSQEQLRETYLAYANRQSIGKPAMPSQGHLEVRITVDGTSVISPPNASGDKAVWFVSLTDFHLLGSLGEDLVALCTAFGSWNTGVRNGPAPGAMEYRDIVVFRRDGHGAWSVLDRANY